MMFDALRVKALEDNKFYKYDRPSINQHIINLAWSKTTFTWGEMTLTWGKTTWGETDLGRNNLFLQCQLVLRAVIIWHYLVEIQGV